jgi:hypothetical protein
MLLIHQMYLAYVLLFLVNRFDRGIDAIPARNRLTVAIGLRSHF